MQGPDVIRLLDAAKAVTKSDYATAKATGISTSNISDWRHGRRTMPACDVALVADVAGLDAVAWTARAVAQSHEGTKKGDALSAALKKALASALRGPDYRWAGARRTGKLLDTMYQKKGSSVTNQQPKDTHEEPLPAGVQPPIA